MFPESDHGMYEFVELPDGSRRYTRIKNGYFRLVANWIHGRRTSFNGEAYAL
ncbi:MAG TPA: hypothetical protein VL995_10555 [Cellvibrio sp.]|nr:hypothetical protein [Cellvibrio sp.]